jgi:hypothetical protein
MSDVFDNKVDDSIALLIRDHYIYANSLNRTFELRIENECNSITGLLTLSDVSFIIECTDEIPIIKYCPIVIKVPEISESFLSEYFKRLYPDQSVAFSNSFI